MGQPDFYWNAADASNFAKRSFHGKQGTVNNPGKVLRAVDATAISGYSYDASSLATAGNVSFAGRNINYNAAGISVSLRFKPTWSGTPASARGLLTIGLDGSQGGNGYITFLHSNATGQIYSMCRSTSNTLLVNTGLGAWSPTANTWYDFFWKWDWTNGANSYRVDMDGSLLGQTTPSGNFITTGYEPISTYDFKILSILGCIDIAPLAGSYVEEFGVWSSLESSTNIDLESGPGGTLNGASRTSLISATAYDGLAVAGGLNKPGFGKGLLG